MEPTQSSETLAYKIQTPGKFPEDYIIKLNFVYKSRTKNLMKVRQLEAELFYEDGRTNGQRETHDKVKSLFRNFAKVPKNAKQYSPPPAYKIIAMSTFKALISRQPF
jgi:hypothetical protein